MLKGFMQPFRAARQSAATVRFETEPGEQAQVDWGHFGNIQHHGRRRKLYAFVMTLGWSRAMYVEFTLSTDAAWFLRCHLHAFEYFGGASREVLHDNLKTAVLSRDADGGVRWHPRYLDFADYCGFRPRACQPYRAQTKGKVESGIRYVRGNFWPGLRFTDLADLNQQVREWLDTVANVRTHGTTGEAPFARLPLEPLQPLSDKPAYDTSLITYRRCSRDCLISYAGNYYSVPSPYVRQTLTVKESAEGTLVILDPHGQEIACHRLALGRHQRVVIPAHYQGISASIRLVGRPSAIQVPPILDAPLVEARSLRCYEQLLESIVFDIIKGDQQSEF